jgi:hypothetical protein
VWCVLLMEKQINEMVGALLRGREGERWGQRAS